MAWEQELILKVRAYLDDLDASSYKYSDEKLKKYILLSLELMQLEFRFRCTYYSVDIINETISPDPTDEDTRDNDCIGLIVLKVGALLSKTEARVSGGMGSSYKIVDEGGSFERKNDVQSMLELSAGYGSEYDLAKLMYMRGGGLWGHAVLRCGCYFWEDPEWYRTHYNTNYIRYDGCY